MSLKRTIGLAALAGLVPATLVVTGAAARAEFVTVDRFVAHTSTVPANAGQRVGIFVHEKVSADLALRVESGYQPEGRVVLFVHGGSVPSVPDYDLPYMDYSWMAYLATAGFDTFSMDQTGYGLSPRPMMGDPCNMSEDDRAIVTPNPLAKDCQPHYRYGLSTSQSDWDEIDSVVDYVRELRGVDRVSLVGWSAGGPRTGGYAARHPEKVDKLIRMGEAIAQAYDLAARSDHDPADANRLVEQASQDADEIRTRAAEQARRTLDAAEREAEATRVHAETCAQLVRQEGESRAEVQAAELHEINRQARGMLSDVQRDVARCLLEIGAAAERDARTLLATADAADGQVPAGTPADVEVGTVKRQAPADAVRSIVDAGPYTAGERGWSLTWTSGLAAGGLAGGALLMFLAVSFGAPNQPDMWVEVGQSAPVASALSKTGNVRSVTELIERAQASSGERGPSLAQVSYASRLAAPPPSGLMITFKAERACWISAVVDGGERLERLMEADDTIVLHARDEALVKVGNAGALSVLINNREVKPLGTDGQVVDLRINQATYRAYLRDRL